MYAKLFADATHLLVLPILALLLFVSIFAVVVVRTMSKKPREYAAAASLPLTGD
jgi:hypothetical protein